MDNGERVDSGDDCYFRVDREAQAGAFAAQRGAGSCELLKAQRFGEYHEEERHGKASY
jgi:hypothetical protein